ncbi:HPr family phosphocarrier protein [Marinomonas mediterranea]|jgi:Phosphotransferase System HPr (HPr) Family|uniref:Phosphotransferase system, phosphocarrier protein HPr n=1 Tax=Marinomonas mediterranea (strain ATCC 700492 / JCM 21426 / NBRC 103028 / MMB-1) TaxID=717774 RepID=F2K198_MARM1|nr:HPr family phosphocarrier protein [Marinomonas mediterranea]ADZ91029.1 Phosphotransferase system, phosphocarrier protein HPr [Marinomonas mediterranea MMB-1]WCN09066.1 HPr family phosphocarrier protein [Marinomonas mediterranea]WCN13097.1 HPr family phosphocarrier protein [Marinomonas mediterranea]WCN17168.1 HPr family phosphocarrier protein [Marinomonas mediterranea MMB-1]
MQEKTVTIVNKLGLHARAASKLVETTTRFSCDITIEKDGRNVDGKSIMAMMMLAASKGTDLKIKANGDDEIDAMDAIVEVIANRFGEAE